MQRPFELPDTALQPPSLWSFFKDICQIPRASGNTLALQDWLLDFAAQRGLESARDAVGNVLIRKPASKGKETSDSVILQAHMDMVCEKNAGTVHDFSADPIQPYLDGDWMKAKGTTLGADNGIGLAAQLAVLDDNSLCHGSLECLFTVDEETGLNGAFGLQAGFLKGQKLINLDSEDDGELFIGCAGGMNSRFSFRFDTIDIPANVFFFTLTVSGLQGGHSGDDIDKGRGNANNLLVRFLYQLGKSTDLWLHHYQGGNLSNAIPREATCLVGVPYDFKEEARIQLNLYLADLEEEFGDMEPSLAISLSSEPNPDKVLGQADSNRFLAAMYACPNGVIAMSHTVPGLVETSLNLASVKPVDPNEWVITTSQRSALTSAKMALSLKLEALFVLAGMEAAHGDGYPGWKPNPDSPLVQLVVDTYRSLFDKEARVRAIHAGLECGLFLEKYPSLDMISFGPTMRGVHSPDERLQVSTVESFWRLLTQTLKRL